MYCENCYKEIENGENYYSHIATGLCFCSLECLTDWLIYSHAVEIESLKTDGQS